jgi:hypothetical protein
MANQKKYVVAPGCSFVGNKKSFKAGDEIAKEDFKDEKYFNALISAKKIVPAPAEGAENTEEKKLDRKEKEELAVKNNLVKADQVSKLKDDELEKVLKDAGLVK